MHQAGLIVLVIAALVLVSVVAYRWVNSFVLSIYGYRSPLKDAPPLSEGLTTPLTEQVVLVVVDGLRYDTSLKMPYLNSLRQGGAHARLLASPPSTTQTAWVTLISGADPEVNDMPLFGRSTELLQPLTIDHLFATARRAGLSVGIAGYQWWEKLVPPDSLDLRYFVQTGDDAADRRVLERALVFIDEFAPNFLLVNLRQMEEAGNAFGADSVEYEQAALRCDQYIQRLAAAMNLQRSVLAVASSHGYLPAERDAMPALRRFLGESVPGAAGGYGGDEAVVLTTPLVLTGENVAPGEYGTLRPTDLAPIIAALLGTPIPSSSEGQLPTYILPMDIETKAEKLLALAQQRVRMGNIYVYSIEQGTLTQTPEGDFLVAQSSMAVKNYESAADLALLSTQQTDREVARARQRRLQAERLMRAPAALAVLFPVCIAWIRRRKQLVWNVLAALLAAGLYHALFLWTGGQYSFSQIPPSSLTATLEPSLRRAGLSLAAGGLLVALSMWRRRQRSIFRVIYTSYSYTMALISWIALPIAACAWWNGVRFAWYIPNLTMVFVHFALLVQVMLTAALAIVVPLPVLIVQRALLAFSDWRARVRSNEEA